MKAEVTVKENYEFRRIYRKARSAVAGALVVYCRRNPQGRSRLGVTVSTKVGKAVVRNRVRRRLREIYRLHLTQMKPGYDVVVVARVRAAVTTFAKLERTYLALLEQLQLLEKQP